MKSLPLLALASVAIAGCGSTHAARSYSDHDVVYRTPPYDDRYYYEDNGPPGPLYYQPGYGPVPVYRHGTMYDEDDGYYYYRD